MCPSGLGQLSCSLQSGGGYTTSSWSRMASSTCQVGILGQQEVGMKISFACMFFIIYEFICKEVVSGISDEKKQGQTSEHVPSKLLPVLCYGSGVDQHVHQGFMC